MDDRIGKLCIRADNDWLTVGFYIGIKEGGKRGRFVEIGSKYISQLHYFGLTRVRLFDGPLSADEEIKARETYKWLEEQKLI